MPQALTPAEMRALIELLERGVDDWVPESHIAEVVIYVANVDDPRAGKDVALRIVRELLERGWMKAGNIVRDEGFVADSDAGAIDLLERLWPADQFPYLGEIGFWLSLTDAGAQFLATLPEERGSS